MKFFFVLFLLINIIFFLWEMNSRSDTQQSVISNSSEKQILLVSELADMNSKNVHESVAQNGIEQIKVKASIIELRASNKVLDIEETPESVVAESVVDNGFAKVNVEEDVAMTSVVKNSESSLVLEEEQQHLICYQVGPFNHQNEVEAWAHLNTISPLSLTPYKQSRKIVSSYLVYYPAADSYQKSKENVTLLKQKGIKDLWLFRKGELKGAISLGLFVKESRAFALKKTLVNKGINVDVKKRYKVILALYVKLLAKRNGLVVDDLLISECKAVE